MEGNSAEFTSSGKCQPLRVTKGPSFSRTGISLLAGCLTSQQHASVSQGWICSENLTCCHTEIEVADLSTSPSHSILTPGRPVPALTLYRQAPGRVATGVPIFESLVWLDPEKSRRKRDLNPGSSALEADALTTRPTRRYKNKGPTHVLW